MVAVELRGQALQVSLASTSRKGNLAGATHRAVAISVVHQQAVLGAHPRGGVQNAVSVQVHLDLAVVQHTVVVQIQHHRRNHVHCIAVGRGHCCGPVHYFCSVRVAAGCRCGAHLVGPGLGGRVDGGVAQVSPVVIDFDHIARIQCSSVGARDQRRGVGGGARAGDRTTGHGCHRQLIHVPFRRA